MAIHGILHITEVEWDRFQRDMGSIPEITAAELEAERAHKVLRDQMRLALLHGTFNEPTLRDIEAYFVSSIKPFIGAPVTEGTVDAETTPQRRNGPDSTT